MPYGSSLYTHFLRVILFCNHILWDAQRSHILFCFHDTQYQGLIKFVILCLSRDVFIKILYIFFCKFIMMFKKILYRPPLLQDFHHIFHTRNCYGMTWALFWFCAGCLMDEKAILLVLNLWLWIVFYINGILESIHESDNINSFWSFE